MYTYLPMKHCDFPLHCLKLAEGTHGNKMVTQ